MVWWEKIVYAGLAAICTAFVFSFWNLAEDAPTVDLPSEAVVAFNLEECPRGWREYPHTYSRTIIGVGQGPGLTNRTLEEQGGLEKIYLSVDELPSHTHSGNISTGGSSFEHIESNERFPGESWKLETGATGGGNPHDNMPPFVALRYCRKD